MPTYLMNTFLPDPVTTPGSERQWMITWGTTGDGLYYLTDGAPYSRALPLLLGACRANGWSCDGKWRWIMDHTWGAGSYDTTNLDSTAAVETGSIFYRILGGWGGVSAVDATPTTAEAGNEHFVWKPLTGTMVQFSAQTQDGGGHNSTSGHLGQEFGTFDIFKYGFLGLHTSLGGKGGFLDDPVVANVNQSRLYFWKNDDTSNNNVTGGGPGTGIAGVAIELSGEEEPDWEARCASCFNHEKDMKIYAANVDGSAVYAAVGVDSSSNFNSSVVGTNGFAEQYMQREFVLFKALDFAVVMDRSKVATPTTYKRAWRMVVPSLPTFDGTTTHPYAGWWQSTNSTYFKVENISGGPGSGAWSGTDADGTRGTFNRTHGRMFVLPVTTGTAYDAFVARGYDSGFTNSALLYDSNLIFQQTGNPGRPTSVEADRFGTASAYTVTTSPCVIGFTDTPTLLASTVIRRLSLGGAAPVRNLAITATDNSAKTVTVTATTCPSIPMGTPVDYAIFRYAAGEKKYQWDAAAQRIGGWGRIELPKFSTTENWVVAMHFGDSDTFSTPTAVTAIDSASQFGLQAHGNGVEAVVLFSDAYVDIGTSMFDAVPTSSFPLGGSTYTYDFTCYTSTAIRHVLPNHQPATTYTVSVSNLGGTSCRASVTKTGGAITVLAIDGVLTFTTTGTTVS